MKVAYIRVSTEEQNEARQVEMMKGLSIEKTYIEKASGKDINGRPQFKAMMDFVREGDTVIVESYSRLARSVKDLLNIVDELNNKGVAFVSLKENIDTSTPQGRLMMVVFAGLAQFEREQTLQRQAEGIAIAKAEGKYKGRKALNKPENYDEVVGLWRKGDISAVRAMDLLGCKKDTFYRWTKA